MIRQFWDWYKTKLAESITIVFIIHILQIPHMVWNGDLYLQTNLIAHHNGVLDFILYGIDLIEIPSIFNVGLLWVYHMKNRKKGKNTKC